MYQQLPEIHNMELHKLQGTKMALGLRTGGTVQWSRSRAHGNSLSAAPKNVPELSLETLSACVMIMRTDQSFSWASSLSLSLTTSYREGASLLSRQLKPMPHWGIGSRVKSNVLWKDFRYLFLRLSIHFSEKPSILVWRICKQQHI